MTAAVAAREAADEATHHHTRRNEARDTYGLRTAERNAAMRQLVQDHHLNYSAVSRVLVLALEQRGFSQDEIAKLGVGHETVRRAVTDS